MDGGYVATIDAVDIDAQLARLRLQVLLGLLATAATSFVRRSIQLQRARLLPQVHKPLILLILLLGMLIVLLHRLHTVTLLVALLHDRWSATLESLLPDGLRQRAQQRLPAQHFLLLLLVRVALPGIAAL